MANDEEASSSNSSNSNSTQTWKYDVFLSFRGEDTRKGFTDHLYHALRRSGFRVFRDDGELKRGKIISHELLQAIEESRFAIVIVSENYASSSWCLNELQHILASRHQFGQRVYPIFYGVDPSDVRHQRGNFGKAFANLEGKLHDDPEKVEEWRYCLTEVGRMFGPRDSLEFSNKWIEILLNKACAVSSWPDFELKQKWSSDRLMEAGTSWGWTSSEFKQKWRNFLTKVGNISDWTDSQFEETWADSLREAGYISRLFGRKEFGRTLANCLMVVGNVSGWTDSKFEYETQLIDDVVQKLWEQFRSQLPFDEKDTLIGIDWRLDEMHPLLQIGSRDVRFIGICGMGGVGKTTLARAIYERFHRQFDFHCFLANVREISERDGDVHLQTKLFSNLNVGNMHEIADTHEGKSIIRNFFSNKKVLLILDDVSSIRQLENLAGSRKWFGMGSRVIITTRDVLLLRLHKVDKICEVKQMNHDESLRLFCQKAFGRGQPEQGFLEMCEIVIDYAGGLPLALCVLGSFLRGKGLNGWEHALHTIKRNSKNNIFKTFRISYDALSPIEKKTFLDIACFFNMWGKDEVRQILESCGGLDATIGMDNLIEKSLLAEVELGNSKYIEMHNLVQEMGRNIVWAESDFEIRKQSRLWSPEDIDNVLRRDAGNDVIKGVVLPYSFARDDAYWHPEALLKMDNLRLLIVSCNFGLPRGFKGFPWLLKVVQWYGYPLEAPPFDGEVDELVHLKMQNSKIQRLSNGELLMQNLKLLDLSYSKNLIETPHFSGFQNLERLVLEGCTKLVEIHLSLGQLNNLVTINLKGCINLKVLPREWEMTYLREFILEETGIEEVPELLGFLTSVEVLNLRSCRNLKVLPQKLEMNSLKEFILCGCTQVRNLPEFGENMKNVITLDVEETSIAELPGSLGSLIHLKNLNLRGCKCLVGLPHSIHLLKDLKVLNITGCSNFSKLPENLNENKALELLDASETAITEVPSSIGHLKGLKTLSFHRCSFPTGLILPDSIFNIESLVELDLSYCNIEDGIIPCDLGGLSSLKKLDLSGNMFVDLPAGCISNLLYLRFLYLNSCPKLQFLPQPSPFLDLMDAGECASLLNLSDKELLNLFASIDQSGQYAERLSQRLDACTMSSLSMKSFSATVPGSEIPSWFKRQDSLDPENGYEVSIKEKVPSGEWLGFVLCIVLKDNMFYSTEAYQNTFCWRFYLTKASDGNLVFLQGRGRKHEKKINSPNLWILYGQIEKQNGSDLSKDFSKLLLRFKAQNDGQHSIKCGWRVIRKKSCENIWDCEPEEEQGPIDSSDPDIETTSEENETSNSSLFILEKEDDSRMQSITNKASKPSDCDVAPPIANTDTAVPPCAIQSPTSSTCRECQPAETATNQVNTRCSKAQEQGQWSSSLSGNSQSLNNKCETMSVKESSPYLEERGKSHDLQMQFITEDPSRRHFAPVIANPTIAMPPNKIESPSSSSWRQFQPTESVTIQEPRIRSDDSVNGAKAPIPNSWKQPVSIPKQNPSRVRNYAGDTLVTINISKPYAPESEQTSAQMIFNELSQVSGLEEAELLQIYDILTSDERKYESFMALPPPLKKPWILMQITKYYS